MADSPTTPDLACDWTAAEVLLRPFDRFTRADIVDDFPRQVRRGEVYDLGEAGLKATPVADNRYTVVWRAEPNGRTEVMAVAAAQYRGETPEALRRKLGRAVEAQSHGLVSLYR